MAPRRGGGSSGNGGGGSGGLSSPWSDRLVFSGSNFTDPITRGYIVVGGIRLFAIVVVAIWAATSKKKSLASRSVFRWFRYWFSILTFFIALGMSFAGWMIEDQSADVQRIYLLIEIILSNFIYLAEISLLLTIWCLLSYCAMKPQHGSAKPYRMLGRFHLLFACVLLGLWVGIMYSSIDYRLQRIRYNVTRYDAYSGLYNRSRRTWRDLNVAYTALYLVASIETVALTVINYVQSRGQNNEGSIHILTLALVSGPLLIRSLFLTGVVGAGFARIIDSKAQLACSIIIQVCFVIIYAGIIVVVTHLDRVRYPPPTGGPPLPTQQRGPPLPPMTEQKYPQANTSTLPPNPQVGMNAPSNGTHHSLPTVSSWTPTNDLNAQPNGTAWPVQNHHPAGYAPVPQQQPPSDSTSPPPAQWTRFS